MTILYTPIDNEADLLLALDDLPDPVGPGVLLELKPNKIFHLDQTLTVRKRIILRGNGARLVFTPGIDGIHIEIPPEGSEAEVHPIFDAKRSLIQDLLIRTASLAVNDNHGIRNEANGVRIYNVWIHGFGTGMSFDSQPDDGRSLNCNRYVVRDCRIDGDKNWTRGVFVHGGDSNAITFDHLTISGVRIGIESAYATGNNYYGIYIENHQDAFRIAEGADYSTLLGCMIDSGQVEKIPIESQNVLTVGGNLPRHEFLGDRLGAGRNKLVFYEKMIGEHNEELYMLVNIPNSYRFDSPLFWQIRGPHGQPEAGDQYGWFIHYNTGTKEWSFRYEGAGPGSPVIRWAGEDHPTEPAGKFLGTS